MLKRVDLAFDSQVLTYFLDANRGEYQISPQDPLREQRVAAYRLFLYCTPFIVPTVTTEAERIGNDAKLEEHLRFIQANFAECVPDERQIAAIERRTAVLASFHQGQEDCRILAEVESCGLAVLVTFDEQFQKRLAGHTTVQLHTPKGFWDFLAIPPGTPPIWSPAPGHPLAEQTWWKW